LPVIRTIAVTDKCFCSGATATQTTMLSWVQEAVKMNPFSSPFTTAKCQALQEDGARSLVPNRNIAAAAVAEGGQ